MDLRELEAILVGRRDDPPPGSYSATLLRNPDRAARKIMEEAFELSLELTCEPPERQRVIEEAADVLFHVLAGIVGAHVTVDDVLKELERRRR